MEQEDLGPGDNAGKTRCGEGGIQPEEGEGEIKPERAETNHTRWGGNPARKNRRECSQNREEESNPKGGRREIKPERMEGKILPYKVGK
jgi:hypothetical protein